MGENGAAVMTVTPTMASSSPVFTVIPSPTPTVIKNLIATPVITPASVTHSQTTPTVTETVSDDGSSASEEASDNNKEATATEIPSPMDKTVKDTPTLTSIPTPEIATPTETIVVPENSPTPESSINVESEENSSILTPVETRLSKAENEPTAVPTAIPETGTTTSISIPFEEGASVLPKSKRVRTSQNFSFYSFLSAGFVINDAESRDVLGKVYAFEGDPSMFSKPMEAHVKLVKPARSKVGDLLTIYRLYEHSLDTPESDFQGSWAEIEAVVQIEDMDKDVAQVKILEGFKTFSKGDMARDYGSDVKRWKKAQIKKNLPMTEVECYVAGGDPLYSFYKSEDTIVLTAGSRKGIVEGMLFELDQKTDRGLAGPPLYNTFGSAEVFFSGNSYSLARVVQCRDKIQKGFVARYRP
jgi:hypothetical protein